MVRWEHQLFKKDFEKKYYGLDGFIHFEDAVFVRGHRFLMEHTEEYIGILGIIAYRI